MPDSHVAEKGGSGIPNADFIFYGLSSPTNPGVLAYASACQFDDRGRPTAGFVNFGPAALNFNKLSVIEDWTGVVMHEILHALGFSSGIWEKNFKHPATGQSYQPTAYFNERGVQVRKFTSPNAVLQAQKYFSCPSLNGVEIETSGGSGTAGSHLEQRIYMDSVMTGSQTANGKLHPVTLGILEDSGWYKVDYNVSGPNLWGKRLGCDFPLQKCLNGSKTHPTSPWKSHFCYNVSSRQEIQCSLDRQYISLCRVSKWTSPLPDAYQYFSDPTLGGASELPDFCPTYGLVNNGHCTDTENAPPTNYWGQTYGSSSSCLTSTLEDKSFQRYLVSQGVGCYRVGCGGSSYTVTVGGQTQTCSNAGTALIFNGFRGAIICAPWAEVCGKK